MILSKRASLFPVASRPFVSGTELSPRCFLTSGNAVEFRHQFFPCFGKFWMDDYAIDRANLVALMGIVVPDAFGAKHRIDFEYFWAHRDRAVRTFSFADITVDAVVCNQ